MGQQEQKQKEMFYLNNILYCFITHQPFVLEDYYNIKKMMNELNYNNFLIFYGGNNLNYKEKEIINLDCKDDYCSLPEKTHKLFCYLNKNKKNFDFYCKIDRTTKVLKIYDKKIEDYCGFVQTFSNTKGIPEQGKYHFSRAANSKWHQKEFIHEDIEFCQGCIYFTSNKCLEKICNDNNNKHYVYEDVYVASVLKKHKIYPKKISLKDYFFDEDHKNSISIF